MSEKALARQDQQVANGWGLKHIEKAAEYIVKSRLFGIQTKEQAIALMLLAQAEGIHPVKAIQEYHIIQGRPAMKADAMLARFLQAGGKVEWHELNDTCVRATFIHPQGGTATIEWTLERAKKAGLTDKDNWKKYPRQMLRARVISEGVRTVYPAVATGIYTPEEVMDFEDAPPEPKVVEVQAERIEEKPEPKETKLQETKKPASKEASAKTQIALEIKQLMDEIGYTEEDLIALCELLKMPISSTKQLRNFTVEQLTLIRDALLEYKREQESEREAEDGE